MGLPRATVSDPVDIRELDCQLPLDTPVSYVALELANLLRLPLVGPDDRPLNYALAVKGAGILDPGAALSIPEDTEELRLRVIPHIVIGSADSEALESGFDESSARPSDSRVVPVSETRALLHDDNLDLRSDVRIDAEIRRQIERFAAEDRHTECAGLLLGEVFVENGKRVIYITAAIPAREALVSRTSVELTPEAWAAMLHERDIRYSHLRVLGWFHTHAGWGVFLSDSDVFLHRHFFPHPNMVAYVLDPTTGRDGFFSWHNGKIGLCPSYALVGDSSAEWNQPTSKKKRKLRLATGAALSAVLCFGVVGPYLVKNDKRQVEPPIKPVTVVQKTSPHTKEPTVPIKTYILGKKDNLWKLCKRVYGDGDLAKPLADYNGISDLTRLQVGQEIKLPPKEVLAKLKDTRPLELE